jgi:valyl-tRNA synthetase
MSKSKGNGIDPLDMIAKYGTDAVRLSLVIGTSPGHDFKLYEEKIAGFRNFVTKLWNSARYVLMNIEGCNEDSSELTKNDIKTLADRWIVSRTMEVISETTAYIENFKYSEAGTVVYNFLWSEVCDWYLEIAKQEKNIKVLRFLLKQILLMLHPFVPFITEVLWSELKETTMLINEEWPTIKTDLIDKTSKKEMELIISVIQAIRSIKSDFNISTNKNLRVTIVGKQNEFLQQQDATIKKLAKVLEIVYLDKVGDMKNAGTKTINSHTVIYVHLEGIIDIEKEANRIKKELNELTSYADKLKEQTQNKSFVKNAPKEVLTKKQLQIEEADSKIKTLKSKLESLT